MHGSLLQYVKDMIRRFPNIEYEPRIFAIAAKLNKTKLMVFIERQLVYLRKNKRLSVADHADIILDAMRMSCCSGNKKVLFYLLKNVYENGRDREWLHLYKTINNWGPALLHMAKKTRHRSCTELIQVAVGTWV